VFHAPPVGLYADPGHLKIPVIWIAAVRRFLSVGATRPTAGVGQRRIDQVDGW